LAYSIPTPPPPQGGTVPYLGPYAQNQAAAELAFQRAQAQLAAQRGSLLQQYGYKPTASGGMAVDASNPYGLYQQMLGANANEAMAGQQMMHNRGFTGPGLAGQAETAAQMDAGGRSFQFARNFASAEEQQQEAAMAAQDALANATAQNQYGATQYAIAHNLFTPAAVRLTDAEVQKRVQAMQAAWSRMWGGPNSKSAKKYGGLTFQQRLNQLGANRLYNPTSHFNVGGKTF